MGTSDNVHFSRKIPFFFLFADKNIELQLAQSLKQIETKDKVFLLYERQKIYSAHFAHVKIKLKP